VQRCHHPQGDVVGYCKPWMSRRRSDTRHSWHAMHGPVSCEQSHVTGIAAVATMGGRSYQPCRLHPSSSWMLCPCFASSPGAETHRSVWWRVALTQQWDAAGSGAGVMCTAASASRVFPRLFMRLLAFAAPLLCYRHGVGRQILDAGQHGRLVLHRIARFPGYWKQEFDYMLVYICCSGSSIRVPR
jgi:hypothetical protein